MSYRYLMPGERLPHYVKEGPFDPYAVEKQTPQKERYYQAAEWRIVWWRSRRHRVAVWSGAFLLAMYLAIAIAEFLATSELHPRNIQHLYAPTPPLTLFPEGELLGPLLHGFDPTLALEAPLSE